MRASLQDPSLVSKLVMLTSQSSSHSVRSLQQRGRIPLASQAVTPRELFVAWFVEPEESVEYLDAARQFLEAAFAAVEVPQVEGSFGSSYLDALVTWASDRIVPFADDSYGSSWPVRLVREFAPSGLSAGAWLNALRRVAASVPTARVALVELQRAWLGHETAAPSLAERYAATLGSLGIPHQVVSRWDFDESPACADISYEHALLGLLLGEFSTSFWPEALGLNLWMATLGLCPLLGSVIEDLRLRDADVSILESDEAVRGVASKELALALIPPGDIEIRARFVRGFAAAQLSYERWDRAMRGNNVPYGARDFVLEGIRRKARFAIDHHHHVELKGHNLAALLKGGSESHEAILDHMAQMASLVRPGSPDQSPFMTQALSLDGPMFDVFTAEEKNDMREWIASLGSVTARRVREPVALAGRYVPRMLREPLFGQAYGEYGNLSLRDLSALTAEAESHPTLAWFARGACEVWLGRVREFLETDSRFERTRGVEVGSTEQLCALAAARVRNPSPMITKDWLSGFIDVRRGGFEDFAVARAHYLDWEAKCASGLRRSGADVEASIGLCVARSLAQNTSAFVPELLGIALACEVIEGTWFGDSQTDSRATPALRAFFARVRQSLPYETERMWQRACSGFWVMILGSHGEASETQALSELAAAFATSRVNTDHP